MQQAYCFYKTVLGSPGRFMSHTQFVSELSSGMNAEIMSNRSVFQMQSNLPSISHKCLLLFVWISLRLCNLPMMCKVTEVFKMKKLKYLGPSRTAGMKWTTRGEMTAHPSPLLGHQMCSTRLNHGANDFWDTLTSKVIKNLVYISLNLR